VACQRGMHLEFVLFVEFILFARLEARAASQNRAAIRPCIENTFYTENTLF
jgi:hypothetical protein